MNVFMMDQITGIFSSFWTIFSFSFVVALTGTMVPGPLLTYTIIQAAREKRSGYLIGVFVIVGHAVVELILILFMIAGFSYLIKNSFIIKAIGIIGGIVLVLFGISLFYDLLKGKVSLDFLDASDELDPTMPLKRKKKLNKPVWGGALISMSNPYWWIWWGTVGLALMTRFDVSMNNWPTLAVFFIGHEAGDLLWYVLISTVAYAGIRFINKKIYYGILGLCGTFMIVFGAYLGLSPLFS